MTEETAACIRNETRFHGIRRFENNIRRLEKDVADYIGVRRAVAVKSGAAALHLAIRLAAGRICGTVGTDSGPTGKSLYGQRVFCPDFSSGMSAGAVRQEGGIPVLIDASPEDWGMDPKALASAFQRYPDVRLVIISHAYGFPGRIDEIKKICEAHQALLIEDASEAFGAKYQKRRCGSFGDYGILDFEQDDMIVGITGGMLLVRERDGAAATDLKVAQSVYKCKLNIAAEMIQRQWESVEEQIDGRIAAGKKIYERYAKRLAGLDILMNPYDEQAAGPNYRRSCMTISENGLSHVRWDMRDGTWACDYDDVHGRTCPPELCDALNAFGAESRLVWRPLHRTPRYRDCDFVTADGEQWDGEAEEEGSYIFERSLCLPSDAGMTEEEQGRVIEIIYACFNGRSWNRQAFGYAEAVENHGLF